jgi:hypothetical protein
VGAWDEGCAGEVLLAQAAVIVAVPAHERELLALARTKSLGPVKDAACKHQLEAIDPEELHGRQVDAQRFRTWKNDLGNIAFAGELPPEVGVPFVNRLDAVTDRLWRAASRDSDDGRGSGTRHVRSHGWSPGRVAGRPPPIW